MIRGGRQTDPSASADIARQPATTNREPARRAVAGCRSEGADYAIANSPSDTLAAAACSITYRNTRLYVTYGVLRLKIALSIASSVVIYVTLFPLSGAALRGAETPSAKPNILLIVADDKCSELTPER